LITGNIVLAHASSSEVCDCILSSTRCCAACRERAVVWAAFSRCLCDCASVFPEGVAVRPEELNKFFRPLLLAHASSSEVCDCILSSTRCCTACRERAVVWAAFSRCLCDCASVFPEGVAVRPEELNKFFRPLLTCVVLSAVASAPVEDLFFEVHSFGM
jgi:hypothetical protein